MPAIPTSPVPSNPRVPGSGTTKFVLPPRMWAMPLFNWAAAVKNCWVVVPDTVWPFASVPVIVPVRSKTRFPPLVKVVSRVHVIGPVNQPVKSGAPHPPQALRRQTTSNTDPTEEKIAELPGMPAPLQPERQAPVWKKRLPKAPELTDMLPKLRTCAPVEVIPEDVMEIDPNLLVISIPLAEAATGRANTRSARTTATRLMLVFPPPKIGDRGIDL